MRGEKLACGGQRFGRQDKFVADFTGSQAGFPQQGKVIIRRVDLVVEPDTPRVKPAARGTIDATPAPGRTAPPRQNFRLPIALINCQRKPFSPQNPQQLECAENRGFQIARMVNRTVQWKDLSISAKPRRRGRIPWKRENALGPENFPAKRGLPEREQDVADGLEADQQNVVARVHFAGHRNCCFNSGDQRGTECVARTFLGVNLSAGLPLGEFFTPGDAAWTMAF